MGNESSNSKENKQIKQSNQSRTNNLIVPINNKKIKSPKIVVGIDFGTAGIGYAYSLCDNKKILFYLI